MQYIKEHFQATLEVKQSKFIAHLLPYSSYEQTLQNLKSQHPKARHFVTAFRYLNEYEQIVEHSNDDGEPNGTSGKPSLMVLQGQECINIAVIVVRYFGGTKLGTGGLVRAYSDAVNLAIREAEFISYKKEIYKSITMDYGDVRLVDYECEAWSIDVIEKIFDARVVYKIKSDTQNMSDFLHKLERVLLAID